MEDYIANHLTTKKERPCSADLIKLQGHRLSHSCKKNKRKECRFDFPLPPMRKTRVFRPLRDPSDPDFKISQQNYCKIVSCLGNISNGSDMTFDEYLGDVEQSEDQYIDALRTSIKDVKVFHQRNPDSVRVNVFMTHKSLKLGRLIVICSSSPHHMLVATILLDTLAMDTEGCLCVEVLRPSQPNGVMSSAVSLPNHTFTGQALSSKRLTSIVHILSPETDNCPS